MQLFFPEKGGSSSSRIDCPQVFSACGMLRRGVSCACVFLGYQMHRQIRPGSDLYQLVSTL